MIIICSANFPGFNLLPYQDRAVHSPARFTWNCWARQTGKSFTFSLRRLFRALRRRRNQIILSAGARQSREVMLKIRQHCQTLRLHSKLVETSFYRDSSIRQIEIRLPSGIRLIGLPANPLTARGFTGDVFLDEFAMHRDDEGIWAALFPTLLRGEGELDVASTPRGCRNLFHRLLDHPLFMRFTLTLEAAVEEGLKIDVAGIRAGIGDELTWRQEFCCEFADEATAFLTLDLIRLCHDSRLTSAIDWQAIQRHGAEIYLGVDIGRHRDLTVIWIWERAGDEYITRGVSVHSEIPFDGQEAAISRLLVLPTVARCAIDGTGLSMQLCEHLVNRFGNYRVEPVTFNSPIKTQLAGRLRVAAERAQLRIPTDDEIVADWHSVQRIVTSGSHLRFDADRSSGGHADRFWAAALGLHAAGNSAGPPEFITAGPSAFKRNGAW